MEHATSFYIGGKWVRPSVARTKTIVDPTTAEPIAEISLGDAADVDCAVAAARGAFEAFAGAGPRERIALFERIIAVYEKRLDALADLLAREIGAPVSARVQTRGPLDHLRHTIALLKSYRFETNLAGTIVRREPIGVCGLIAPWNWPLQTPVVKLCSACTPSAPLRQIG